ncbi:DnaJ family molecular chaperone [Afipia sp. GAS231]|uniref:J domain-containing protein n=1 Tax=Afipia sp. GAS231 TaxID=1882747 RepID=UPI00087D2059|nr:J domain-containing protein [Afipia sp. GAS231]SDO20237.1 DnaJ domain-containing protein [Afipia sp. GAS231]
MALAFALPILFVVSVFAFPLFLGFLLLFSRWSSPPALVDIDEGQISAAVRDLETSQADLRGQIAEIKGRGARQGVRYLDAEHRFEMRSRAGQELNQALFDARSSLADVDARLELASRPDTRTSHAWWLAMRAWRKGRAFRFSFIAASAGFIVSAVLLEAIVYQGRRPDLLLWNMIPQFFGPHTEVGTSVGWLLGLATLSIARRRNRIIEERESVISEQSAESLDDLLESQPDADTDIDTQAVGGDPYLILNIAPQASIPEIKAAYRSAIVKCHPDTVADRSSTIRKVAEEEAQRINAAYSAIRDERGFN